MSSQTVKQTWWPIVSAFFYMPFIVFFYVGKKCNDKKWLAIGAVSLFLTIALLSMNERCQHESWFQILLLTTWICGFFLARHSWNTYRREEAWWPLICAICSLPFIVFFYIGKKNNNKKWLTNGAIYLAVFFILFVLFSLISQELITILLVVYWIVGIIHSCNSWKAYLKECQI